jgi:exodeoxyribonuclease VII small subunit
MTITDEQIKEFLTTTALDAVIAEYSFEQGLAILERLVKQVEAGHLPLAQAVTSYERGAILVRHLRGVLGDAEAKLQLLAEDGTVKPLDV